MRTMQLFKGVLLILILKMFTSLLRLSAMDYLVDTIFTLGCGCNYYCISARDSRFVGKKSDELN